MILLFTVLYYALQAYYYILIAYILMSWIPELRGSKVHKIIHSIANPYMRIFRGLLVFGRMDFTPIIGFFLYQIGLRYFGQMINIMIANG